MPPLSLLYKGKEVDLSPIGFPSRLPCTEENCSFLAHLLRVTKFCSGKSRTPTSTVSTCAWIETLTFTTCYSCLFSLWTFVQCIVTYLIYTIHMTLYLVFITKSSIMSIDWKKNINWSSPSGWGYEISDATSGLQSRAPIRTTQYNVRNLFWRNQRRTKTNNGTCI